MNAIKKTFIFILCTVLIVAGVAAIIYLPRRTTYNKLIDKYSKTNTPNLYIVPTEKNLQASSSKSSNEKKLSLHGLRFSTPWGDPLETNTNSNVTSYKYSNNMQLTILDESDESTIYETLRQEHPDDLKIARDFWGSDIITSKYKFTDSVLKLSPEQITPSLTKKELVKKDSLLNMKMLITPKFEDKIFKYSINKIKVFQFGNVTPTTEIMILEVYGEDNSAYTIIFKGIGYTQNDIDNFIVSLETNKE